MSLTTEVPEEPQSSTPKDELKTLEKPQENDSKLKFTVYGKVNSKGTRYEVVKIIEADNKDIASSIYKERIKLEFQGIRNITCIKPEEFKEGDTEFSKEIELPKATQVESKDTSSSSKLVLNGKEVEIPKELNNYESGYLVYYYSSLRLSKLNLYTCYYSPKKKINNSYRKNNLLLYTSFNEIDAIGDIKNEMTEHGIPFKEKYIHELKEVSLQTLLTNTLIRNEVLKRAEKRFNSIEEAYENYKAIVHNSPTVHIEPKEEK